MSLMPSKKTWVSPDGAIEIEMITYRTVMVDRLRDALRKHKDENGDLPDEVARFILCAGHTTAVRLKVDSPPAYAASLNDLVNSPAWRKDPVKDYDSLDFAPSDVMAAWWVAYSETRDTSLEAPPELQQVEPLPPEPDANGEVDADALNFTPNSTGSGGTPSIVKLSTVPGKAQAGRQRRAK